jgi:hypothetical protein
MTAKMQRAMLRSCEQKQAHIQAISAPYRDLCPEVKVNPPLYPPEPRNYREYIAGPYWRAKRIEVLAARGAQCERCFSDKQINVHHKSYVRLGKELPQDLLILCRNCHKAEHGILDTRQNPTESRVTVGPRRRDRDAATFERLTP